jgi:hypothetical protein
MGDLSVDHAAAMPGVRDAQTERQATYPRRIWRIAPHATIGSRSAWLSCAPMFNWNISGCSTIAGGFYTLTSRYIVNWAPASLGRVFLLECVESGRRPPRFQASSSQTFQLKLLSSRSRLTIACLLVGWCAMLRLSFLPSALRYWQKAFAISTCPGQRDAPSHSRYRNGERIRLKICKDRHGAVTLWRQPASHARTKKVIGIFSILSAGRQRRIYKS